MFTLTFEIVLVTAAFILGALEGPRLFAWVTSWFVKEVKAVETKIGPTGTH
jgi:hypothetical protein